MLVLDKPPIEGEPPILPPYLRPEPRPERRVIIVPDIRFITDGSVSRLSNAEFNWWTHIHSIMNRITGDGFFDGNCKIEVAHSHSRIYRQWLETYQTESGVPPHITFGGAIQSGEGDPTFYKRWVEWAKETFV